MKTARLLVLLAVAAAAASLLPRDAGAAPVFARKYGLNCTMCHSAYPRLNDFGARFRANGYRLPGREHAEKTVLESPAPVAMRTNAGYVYDQLQHDPDPTGNGKRSVVELGGLDVLSGGTLGPRIGYFMVYVPAITESRGVAGQEAALEMASVVFSGLARDRLTVRAGRFEPAYTACSVKRQLGFAACEVYGYSFPGGPAFSETQTGIEVRGGGYGPLRVVGGLVAGSGTNHAGDPPQDGYLRLEGVLGPGEGQTAGQRFGLTGYAGRARPDLSVGASTDRAGTFDRFGVDASLNAAGLNLAAQYLWAQDAGQLWGRDDRTGWSGGFAELSGQLMPATVGFARFDYVREPDFLDRTLLRCTAGSRYYFEDNVALHLEYSHATMSVEDVSDDPAEDFLTARVDFAF
jgi:hypothetical protein